MSNIEAMLLTWGFLGILFYIFVNAESIGNDLLAGFISVIIIGPYMLVAVVLYWIAAYILAFIVYLKFLKADEEELEILKVKRREPWGHNPINQVVMQAYDLAFHWWYQKTNKE